jgi:hypothetical protein
VPGHHLNLCVINIDGDLGTDMSIILKCILNNLGGREWTGLIWLRIGTSGRVL